MDAALLVSTLIATTFVAPISVSQSELIFSRRKRNLFAIQVVVVLAFGLLALSVIECIPSRFLFLFANDHERPSGSARVSLTAAYSAVLTGLCGCLLVIFPVVVGAHLVPTKRGDPDAPVATDHYFYRRPKTSSALGKLLSVTAHAMYASLSFFVRLSLLCGRLLSRRIASTSRRGNSSGIGRRDSSSLLPLVKGITPQEHQDQLQQDKAVRAVSGKILGILSVIALWWTLLGLLAPFVIQIPQSPSSFSASEYGPSAFRGALTLAISRLCAVGLLLSALVNGFGSVSFPFASLTPFYLKPVTNESIAIAEAELARLQASLEERRYQVANLSSASLVATSGTNTGSSFGGGKRRNSSFSDLGDDFVQRRASIASEIAFVEALIEDTKDDVDEMRHAQRLSSRARTTGGRVLSWLGVIMSIVLLARLLTITVSLNWWSSFSRRDSAGVDESIGGPDASPSSRTDIVTVILLWTMGHTKLVSSQQQLNQLSQFISVVLSSFLSVSQVRTFLRTASALNRRLSGLCGTCHCHPSSRRPSPSSSGHPPLHPTTEPGQLLASTVYSYGLATLGGCYFLACVVLTKLMLPEPYRRSFSRALLGPSDSGLGGEGAGTTGEDGDDDGGGTGNGTGALPARGHHQLLFWVRSDAVNLVFIASAVASALTLGALFGIQRQNTHRYVSWTTGRSSSSGASRAAASAV